MMRDESTLAYIRRLFAAEDAALQSARRRHESDDLPTIHISPDEGKLLHVLLRAVRARRVLEIGTLGGYSGIWIARALPEGGTLTTIERDPRHAAVARRSFREAGVADQIELLEGDARRILGSLTPGFDAVFVDADKAPLPTYYRESMRLLREGGLLLCDNSLYHERVIDPTDDADDVRGVREFNRLAAADERLAATVVPIRDGLLVGVKLGP
jgi:predicted O-methyltransferase YrrM